MVTCPVNHWRVSSFSANRGRGVRPGWHSAMLRGRAPLSRLHVSWPEKTPAGGPAIRPAPGWCRGLGTSPGKLQDEEARPHQGSGQRIPRPSETGPVLRPDRRGPAPRVHAPGRPTLIGHHEGHRADTRRLYAGAARQGFSGRRSDDSKPERVFWSAYHLGTRVGLRP